MQQARARVLAACKANGLAFLNQTRPDDVKDMIADIFRNEDTAKPLSDQEVVLMLSQKGIVIARRTVAKYRSELNILPSNLRKVY